MADEEKVPQAAGPFMTVGAVLFIGFVALAVLPGKKKKKKK